jgi:AcrR family transcriptional regulator
MAVGRRDDIVRAAFGRVAAKGLSGLRMRDVAAGAGVNIATVHYHLTSKTEVVRAVVEYAHEQFAGHATPAPGGGLRQHLDRVFALLERDPQLGHVLAEVALEAGRDPVVAEIVRASEARWSEALQALLAPLPARRARPIARLVILTVKGACLPPTSPAELRAAKRELVRCLPPPGETVRSAEGTA